MSNSLSPLVAISSSPSTSTVVSPTAEAPARPVAVQQEMSAALPSALLQPAADPSTSHQPPVSLTATSPLSPSKFTRFVHLFNPSTSPSSSVEALAEGTRAQGVTYSSLSGRRGSRSSGEQTYSTRARSGTWDSSGGIGELPFARPLVVFDSAIRRQLTVAVLLYCNNRRISALARSLFLGSFHCRLVRLGPLCSFNASPEHRVAISRPLLLPLAHPVQHLFFRFLIRRLSPHPSAAGGTDLRTEDRERGGEVPLVDRFERGEEGQEGAGDGGS